MKLKLSSLRDTIFQIIVENIKDFSDFRHYLERAYPELRPHLQPTTEYEEAMSLVDLRTTVVHIDGYRTTIDRFGIEAGKPHLDEYESTIDSYCAQTKLNSILGLKFLPIICLKCEAIKISMEWENLNERTLEDVCQVKKKTFGCLHKRVTLKQVYWDDEEDTVVILLMFPRYLTDSMLVTSQRNLEEVQELGLAQLLVGHYPIYDRVPEDEVGLVHAWHTNVIACVHIEWSL